MKLENELKKWANVKSIKHQRNFINVAKLQYPEGMKQCKHCKGDGIVSITEDDMYIRSCPVCKGKGYVDWITYAVGYVEETEKIIALWPSAGTTIPKVPPSISNKKIEKE